MWKDCSRTVHNLKKLFITFFYLQEVDLIYLTLIAERDFDKKNSVLSMKM